MRIRNIGLIFSAGLLLVITTVGCGPNPYADDIKTLDSLKTRITAVQGELKSMDSTFLQKINKDVFEELRTVKRLYHPDTISMEHAGLINAYKDLRKQVAKYLMLRSRIQQNAPYSVKQLDDLLHDLREQTLKEDEARKHIQTEIQASQSLIAAFDTYKTQTEGLKSSYDSLRPRMHKFVETVKELGGEPLEGDLELEAD